MRETKEIIALFHLLDDPDHDVFSSVSNRIMDFGKGIIPNLENLWENTTSEEMQERIEMIIHRLHFNDLSKDLTEWKNSGYPDLIFGSLLVAKFQYPDLQTTPVLQEIEKIRRNIWLELNSFLTPLEQANVLSSILYNYYNLKGVETNYENPDEYFIHKVLETKKGNPIANGILYLIISELLDIPFKVIQIPHQFVLGYFAEALDPSRGSGFTQEKILFFVDPSTGQPFSHREIEQYFKRINQPSQPQFFKPMSHVSILRLLLTELSKCFEDIPKRYKKEELLALAALLGE